MGKVGAFLTLLRKGKIVANPEKWKNGQITVGIISAVLTAAFALLKMYGYDLGLTDAQIGSIATVIIAINGLFHPVATVVSSEKVGLPAKHTEAGRGTGNRQEHPLTGPNS